MIKFKFSPVNVHCLLERESRNHFCAAENCGVNNDSRNLPHFFCERVLDLHNTGQSHCAIAQELGTRVKEIQNANEMSRNTALSKLSHTTIEHLAHFLFVLSLKYFSGDARKNAFFTASERAIFQLIYLIGLQDLNSCSPKEGNWDYSVFT